MVTLKLLINKKLMAEPTGLEPATSNVTGQNSLFRIWLKCKQTWHLEKHQQLRFGIVALFMRSFLGTFWAHFYLDALRVKIRIDGSVQNRCIYLAIGVNVEGKKETLGLWTAENEGAKFWLSVLTELSNRGVSDIFIGCVDGLKGFTEAIESVFPQTITQVCIVHQIRNSLTYISYKDRKAVAADLKPIYTAVTEDEALYSLELFAEKWDSKYPIISKSWKANWSKINPMFRFPQEIRRAVYTTNVIESLNFSLRKITKTRAAFPTEEAAIKLLWLGLRNIEKKWTMPIQNWSLALNQMAIIFEGRMPIPELSENHITQNS